MATKGIIFIIKRVIPFLFFPLITIGQKNNSLNHGFSIYTNHAASLPEKTIYKNGLLFLKPFSKYYFDFGVQYNFITKYNLGFEAGFGIGMYPQGYHLDVTQINNNDTLPFGDVENIKSAENYNWFLGSTPVFKFPIGINYLLTISKQSSLFIHIGCIMNIQPQESAELLSYYSYSNNTNTQGSDFLYAMYINKNIQTDPKYVIFPEPTLYFNADILLSGKKTSKHNCILGIVFNYAFSPNYTIDYKVYNLGIKYESSGRLTQSNTYFGIKIGYQFLSKGIFDKRAGNKKYLFNQRF